MPLSPEEKEILRAAHSAGKTKEQAFAELASTRAANKQTAFEDNRPLSNKIAGFFGLDNAVDVFSTGIARANATDQEKQFIEPKTGKQIAGAVLQTAAVPLAAAVTGGSSLAGQMAIGAATGYAYDVGNKLAEGRGATESLVPGMGTAAGALVPPVVKGIGMAGKAVIDSATRLTAPLIGKATTAVKEAISPSKNVPDAIGEVLQGKPKDVPKGAIALTNIDTTGVKTFVQLQERLDTSIGTLSDEVDRFLAQDPTRTPLNALESTIPTNSGTNVSANYVETAINHLKELYEKTGDVAKRADIDNLYNAAKQEGLTKLEINDLSRVYNSEFGSKAFSPRTGEALTSVNAQLYENIRSGLKTKAREGLGGSEAAATDKVISSLYNTKALVAKNVERVNQLQQKIADRGLLEKVGHAVTKYADILTGGSLRGFIGGLLPRGAGYKVMNALDLEARLEKNLKLIEKALKSGDDSQIINAVKQLDGITD